MSKIRRTNQGGSVVTFIIAGVILALVLVGGIYALNKHGEQVRKDQAIAAADKERADKEAASNVDNSEASSSSDSSVSDNSDESVSTAQNLPATGSELSISALVGMFLLTVATASYASSRRSLARSL